MRCAKCGHEWRAHRADLTEPPTAKKAEATQAPAQESAAPGPTALSDSPRPTPTPTEDEPPPTEAFARTLEEAEAPAAAEDEEEAPPPPPPPMLDEEFPPPIRPSEMTFKPRSTVPTTRKSPAKAWAVLAVFLTLSLGGFMVFQGPIVDSYPPSTKLYKMLGFNIDDLGYGLKIPEPTAEAIIDGDQRTLQISGVIENTTDQPIDIPLLRGALVDTGGAEIYSWAFLPSESQAFPGETIDYSTRIAYRSGATRILITFVSEQEVIDKGLELIGASAN